MSDSQQVNLDDQQYCSLDDFYGYDSDDEEDKKYGDLTPLQLAAKNGSIDEVQKFINTHKESPDFERLINYNNYRRYNAITLASEFGHWDIVKLLIEHEADINNYTTDKYHLNALFHAILDEKYDMASYLIEKRADIYAYDANKNNLLMNAVTQNKRATIDFLLENEHDVNAAPKKDTNATTMAVVDDNLELAKYLMSKGGKIIPSDKLLHSALALTDQPTNTLQFIFSQSQIEEYSPQCLGLGFFQLLTKPLDDTVLMESIQLLEKQCENQSLKLSNLPVVVDGNFIYYLAQFDMDKVKLATDTDDLSQDHTFTPIEFAIIRQSQPVVNHLLPQVDTTSTLYQSRIQLLADKFQVTLNQM